MGSVMLVQSSSGVLKYGFQFESIFYHEDVHIIEGDVLQIGVSLLMVDMLDMSSFLTGDYQSV